MWRRVVRQEYGNFKIICRQHVSFHKNERVDFKKNFPSALRRMISCIMGCFMLTSSNHVLDALFALASTFRPFLFFPQFWKHQRPNSFYYSRQGWITLTKQPGIAVGRIVEIDSDFERGVSCYSEVATNWRHECLRTRFAPVVKGKPKSVSFRASFRN